LASTVPASIQPITVGNITINGNAMFGINTRIELQGIDSDSPNNNGVNGGTLTVNGYCIFDGALLVNAYGGNVSTNRTGGNGGQLTFGNLILKNTNLDIYGGNDTNGLATVGNGGNLIVNGDLIGNTSIIDLSSGKNNLSDYIGNAGSIVVSGKTNMKNSSSIGINGSDFTQNSYFYGGLEINEITLVAYATTLSAQVYLGGYSMISVLNINNSVNTLVALNGLMLCMNSINVGSTTILDVLSATKTLSPSTCYYFTSANTNQISSVVI
jgi:hypothetical protein